MDLSEIDAKIIEKKKILKDIKDGTLERFTFTNGHSNVWKKFMKIRNSESKNLCSYVQCSECRSLLYFKRSSGTTHLNRHTCNEKEAEGPAYKILPVDKITSIKESVIQNIIKYCATDFVPFEMASGSGFQYFLQWLVTLASKYGNFNVEDIFPCTSAINRRIINFKDDTLRKILENFRDALKNGCCSASLEIIGSDSTNSVIVTMGIHYFDKNFALTKKVIFTTSIDEKSPENTLNKLVHNFNVFGGEENDLQRLTIVTPRKDPFIQALGYPFSRKDCIAYKMNEMLNDSFEMSTLKDTDELLSKCRNIVRFIKDKEIQPLNINVCQENGTWQDKLEMVRSLVEQYDDIMTLLDNENKPNIKFIKRKAEEFISFLEPFMEAISDLSGTSYPTSNKIILWWAILNDHLKTLESYSIELKKIMINVRLCFASSFAPTMEEKINCFLDPRYKLLKMLSDNDRADVISAVQNLLQNMKNDTVETATESSEKGPPNKKSRSSEYEATKSDVKALSSKPKNKDKKDRFSKYETKESDEMKNDECDIYLKLQPMRTVDFEAEIDVVKQFWKSNKKRLPKLFKLVITRLHVPACSSSTELQSKKILELKCLDDFMFVKDNMSDFCEDIW